MEAQLHTPSVKMSVPTTPPERSELGMLMSEATQAARRRCEQKETAQVSSPVFRILIHRATKATTKKERCKQAGLTDSRQGPAVTHSSGTC